jgi:hypothetical protein
MKQGDKLIKLKRSTLLTFVFFCPMNTGKMLCHGENVESKGVAAGTVWGCVFSSVDDR